MSAAAPSTSGLANSPASGGGFDRPQVAIITGLEWRLPPARAAQALLQCADLALYKAKADGKGSFLFYDPLHGDQARAEQALLGDLRLALARGEFEVHYQPIIRLADGEIGGCEALLRWQHPVRGSISPAKFIPMAEAQGLIIPIGRWVLEEACTKASGWVHQRVAVNLSPVQFRNPDLLEDVRHALQNSGLAPDRLELEITEAVIMDTTETTLQTLCQLRALGVRIALDDFGTGYSSLSYLLKFPFDKVKIDQAFIRELGRCREGEAIVDAVIELASRLGMEVTAEGVETLEQACYLCFRQCHHLQGFLFSPARPHDDLREMLALWQPAQSLFESAECQKPGATYLLATG